MIREPIRSHGENTRTLERGDRQPSATTRLETHEKGEDEAKSRKEPDKPARLRIKSRLDWKGNQAGLSDSFPLESLETAPRDSVQDIRDLSKSETDQGAVFLGTSLDLLEGDYNRTR